MAWTRVVIVLLACALLAARQPGASGDGFDLLSLQREVLQTIERVRPAVVEISGRGSGFSGVIVSAEGHVLSVAHAVTPGTPYRVTLPDGRRLRGVGRGANPRADAALIMIEDPPADLPFVSMGDSSTLVANQPCLGLSFPGGPKAGTEPVIRFGRIVRGRSLRGMLQSSVVMEPGDSGGPLFDLNGCVIGIHSRISPAMDHNYEVPINVYREFWNELHQERTFTEAGPPLPRLGIRFERSRRQREDGGLQVVSVIEDGLAAKAEIAADDLILKVYGRALRSTADVREALVAARDEGAESIAIELQRGDEVMELEVSFDVEREAAPEVPLPQGDLPDVPPPRGFPELAGLARQLAELEDRLDEACITISSEFGGEARTITGTRFAETPWIISKSSAVGAHPSALIAGMPLGLDIVARDPSNDLVLLKSPEMHTVGVRLSDTRGKLPTGTFVLSPADDDAGIVSVVGSSAFSSPKQQSRGFFGVMPGTYGENEGAILEQVIEDGAAARAGLLVGDVITRLNDTVIRSQAELRSVLTSIDPGAVVTATLRRDGDELTKTVTLGGFPESSNHAADQIAKSGRRDGFREVLSHDADLEPEECGGPLFDLDGRFVGLNIARNSRVRSFTLPATLVAEFLEQASRELAVPLDGLHP